MLKIIADEGHQESMWHADLLLDEEVPDYFEYKYKSTPQYKK
jgi:hypothetical protein